MNIMFCRAKKYPTGVLSQYACRVFCFSDEMKNTRNRVFVLINKGIHVTIITIQNIIFW